jgi:adenylate kinase
LQNQYALVEQFNIEMESVPKGAHVLFDAHMIIDIGTEVIEIPVDIFEKLAPSRMVLLYEDPEIIIKRRNLDSSRDRPVRATIEIKKQQDHSRKLAAELSDHLSIPFITASTRDISELKDRIT